MTYRCIAFHLTTGERCRRRVSRLPWLRDLRLCPQHGPSVALYAHFLPADLRNGLASGRWTNIRGLGRG